LDVGPPPSHAPVRCDRSWRRRASSRGHCPCCSKSQAGHGRRRHVGGTAQVSSAPSRWKTLTGDTLWKCCGFSSGAPASWPNRPPQPTRLPKPKRPSVLLSISSACKPAGLPVWPTPRPLSSTIKAGGRDAGAALGTVRDRWPTVEDLLCYSGVAPVMERSGKSTWIRWRDCCPKFLRQSFHA